MIRVSEFADAAELDHLRPTWDALLAETPGADFFHTLDWLQVYWRHFGAGQRLRILEISDSDGPLGILPLIVKTHATRIGNFRVVAFPLDYWGSFYGPIGAAQGEILRQGLDYVRKTKRDWDFVELGWMKSSGGSDDSIADAMREAEMPPMRQVHQQVQVVEITQSWEDYWATRKASWRSNCRRNEKKLAKFDSVQHVRYRPRGEAHGESDPRWDLFDQCQAIAESSWQADSSTGTTISHESIRPFLKEAHAAATRAGCLDLNLLTIDGQPAAYNYNYAYCGYVSSLRLGFDPKWSKHGAGTVLTYRMLQDSFRRGDHTFDFLPGSENVKRHWQTSTQTAFRYRYLPHRPGRIELLRTKYWLENRRDGELIG